MLEKLRPLGDRLFVARVEAETRTQGGLYIPEGAKEKGQTGTVLAVGDGKIDGQGNQLAMKIKVGDLVFFGKYSGTDVDEKHLVLREDDVLGVIEK